MKTLFAAVHKSVPWPISTLATLQHHVCNEGIAALA